MPEYREESTGVKVRAPDINEGVKAMATKFALQGISEFTIVSGARRYHVHYAGDGTWVMIPGPKTAMRRLYTDIYVRELGSANMRTKKKTKGNGGPRRFFSIGSRNTRPSVGAARLASDLVQLSRDIDPYGFMDDYETFEDAYQEMLSNLSQESTAVGLLNAFREYIYEDDLEPELATRAARVERDFVDYMGSMGWRSA